MESESADLIYIDPPFFSDAHYETVWKDGAEIRAFEDRWTKMGEGRYSKDINVYLNYMEPRLRELHRVLKPTGSFYLHCDWHADAYLRVLCDQIFGRNPQNVITWKRATAKSAATKKFDVISDTIFFYTKSDDFTFKKQYGAEIVKTRHEYQQEGDRWFKWMDLTAPGTTNRYEWQGTIPSESRQWAYKKEMMDDLFARGMIRTKNGKVMMRGLKKYVNDIPRQSVGDIWDDIMPIVGGAKERLGYPTQKPEALLERIIKASSNEGDVVLDAFAGCGTTLAVAKRLKRQFVGIDVSPTACRTVAERIGYPLHEIVGMPLSAGDVAALSGYEFQNAVIRMLDPTLKTIRVGKRGADGGIDGDYHDLHISVKKYKAGRKDLDEFIAALYRNRQVKGMFIALDYSSTFTKEIARLEREQGITIHAFTLEDLEAGKHRDVVAQTGDLFRKR